MLIIDKDSLPPKALILYKTSKGCCPRTLLLVFIFWETFLENSNAHNLKEAIIHLKANSAKVELSDLYMLIEPK